MIDVFALSVKARPLSEREPSGRPIMTWEEAMKNLPKNPELWGKASQLAKEAAENVGKS